MNRIYNLYYEETVLVNIKYRIKRLIFGNREHWAFVVGLLEVHASRV